MAEPNEKRDRMIAMYSAYPDALEELVAQVFAHLSNDEERIMHNLALGPLARLFRSEESQRLLWRNIGRAVIETARHSVGDDSDGKKS